MKGALLISVMPVPNLVRDDGSGIPQAMMETFPEKSLISAYLIMV
jgi:hypothetical protein